MGRVSPACTVGAADGTAGGGGCCPWAATPTLTAAAAVTTQIVRTIMRAPSSFRPFGSVTGLTGGVRRGEYERGDPECEQPVAGCRPQAGALKRLERARTVARRNSCMQDGRRRRPVDGYT